MNFSGRGEGASLTKEDALHLALIKKELSRQEIRVALLVADGFSNADIAQELNITANTVRSHMKHIHQKLGSRDRGDLKSCFDALMGKG